MNKESLQSENERLKALLKEKDDVIRELKTKVSLLKILHFGPKSEKWTKYDESQALLFNEAEDGAFKQSDPKQESASIETQEIATYKRRKKKHQNQGRKPISPDLPREEVEYDLPEEEKTCACGCQKTCIGAEVSERARIKPASVIVLREKRLKYVCKNCEGTTADEPGVITARGRKHLIPGSMADSSLIAWSINEKYTFSLPLYRQAIRLNHIGLPISRATLSNLVIKAAEKCKPLYDLLKMHIKAGDFINADETRLQVLKEPDRKAQLLSWMWVYCGGPPGKPAVVFQYDQKRSSAVPYEFLSDYSGWLQTDDYSAYQTALCRLNTERRPEERIRHILCWQHARSKFYKAWETMKSEHAKQALDYMRKLFKLEDLRKDFSTRGFFKQRKNRAQLIFEEFYPWLKKLFTATPPSGPLGKALAYTLDNWEQLILYIENPILTPSNNLAENAIRPFVIGRKNWLFCNTPKGAEASAILYSLIETVKLYKMNPYEVLNYIFERLPDAETEADYLALMPMNLTVEMVRLKSDSGRN